MLHEMTPGEFDTLRAFNAIEPFGDERADLRAMVMTARLMNCWIDKNPVQPLDLDYIGLPENKPTASASETLDFMQSITGG